MLPAEENAVVWYSLLPGPGYELFSINPYTGLITTTSYLDREQQQHFTLRGMLQLLSYINAVLLMWLKPTWLASGKDHVLAQNTCCGRHKHRNRKSPRELFKDIQWFHAHKR